jgi:hypothetical protein
MRPPPATSNPTGTSNDTIASPRIAGPTPNPTVPIGASNTTIAGLRIARPTPNPTSTPPRLPTSTPTPLPTSTPTPEPTATPTPLPTSTPTPVPPQGYPITLNGRGNSILLACNGSGEKIVYVGTEQIQSDYNNFGFGYIEGFYLFENIYLTSLIADPYASDLNLNTYAINNGVVGAFTFAC